MTIRLSRRLQIATGLIVAILLLGGVVGWYALAPDKGRAEAVSQMTDGTPRVPLSLGDGSFRARVVVKDHERSKGLSGTRTLAPDDAMLFVFPHDERWGIWMKDMYVSIDIVWLGADKRVVGIKERVAPETFPESFAPEQPARYVVELAAGAVAAQGIKLGDKAVFTVPEGGEA